MKRYLRPARRLGQDLTGLRTVLTPADFLAYVAATLRELPTIARTRSLRPADIHMESRGDYQLRVEGVPLSVEASRFSSVREMYARRVYFAEGQCQLPNDGWVVDLGAAAGFFTTLAVCAGLRTLSVEAQPGFRDELLERLDRNGADLSLLRQECAFVGSGGVLGDPANWQAASHSRGTKIEAIPLDVLLRRHDVDRVGFMKVDIEGSEFALFAEASWLDRVERIAIEVHPSHGSPRSLARGLRDAGFLVAARDADLTPVDVAHADYPSAWR